VTVTARGGGGVAVAGTGKAAGRGGRALGVALAIGSGLALLLAFPPYGWWWLAPVGVGLLALAVRGGGGWLGARYGLLAGLVLFVPLLRWSGLHVGATPWLLLSALQAGYLALLGAASGYAEPVLRRWPLAAPVLTGALWTAQEALRDRLPFGGFPWGRLAFSQADSPLLGLAALGGAPLVTFAVALLGGALAAAVPARGRPGATHPGAPGPGAARWTGRLRAATLRAPAGWLAGVALLTGAAAALPAARPAGPPVSVAIVQGNVPRLGLDFNAQRRAVLDNHVEATLELARRVEAGEVARPDLVVWPENASDIDPLDNPDAAARIDQAAQAVGAPILLGAVLDGPGPAAVRNAGLVWLPDGGYDQMYVKRHPVPFAEYVPLRPVARLVSAQVDRVSRDFVSGERAGVLDVGPVTLGDVICFEVAYDGLVRDTVTGGGQLLVVQTNNATFDPAEASQQLAMVRLRAVEHGRDALMASTVGISAFVTADGRVHQATDFNTAAVTVDKLSTGSARTLATRVAAAPEYALAALALLALLAAAGLRRRARRAAPPEAAASPGAAAAGTRAPTTAAGAAARIEGTDVSEGTDTPQQHDPGYPGVGRVLVVVPTYNEADNIAEIVGRVRRAVPAVDVLVADDNSPDGTGAVADELAGADERVHVLHRAGKQGLGAAYVAGFGWAREHGYDAVVEMDADGSHAPEELARLLDAARDADVVLGSRWVAGGRVVDWPLRRLLLSRGGNLYTRLALGMPLRDATGGYRVYRMAVLDKIDIESVASQGYCFQVDLAWRAYRNGFRVVEVPITFAERQRGTSKMSSAVVREALWRVTVWGTRARLETARRALRGKRA
jgi:apolipoprotein N-acyltransferase